jgi:WD40 repeat protein/tRNA A-37 threonylcarbamoyl transferase component Bud32
MLVAASHPNVSELEAFALGALDNAALAAVESHVAGCPTCQEHVAGVSGDGLVELLRRVHAAAGHRADTRTEVAAHVPTPQAATSAPEPVTLAPASTDSDAAEPADAVPEELARHERYRVVRLLGQGGMGSVYAAEHRVMQRTVALKVINRAYTVNAAAVERFRREVRAAARLAHPNIVHAYDAENAGETHFLVMEYVAGLSLDRVVRQRGPLPVAEACEYVRQAALGLQHAYEQGMVHRDVKPDNLIRCEDGRVKVLDFGLAALTAERGNALTDLNAIMGTPEYMAPEQAEDARTADVRADVYSLGCTLYHLLTGGIPYPAATALLKVLAHREQPVPSVRQARPEVPPELADVVARMMAKRPADRYPTPGEVAAALQPFTHAAAKPPRKRRPLLAVAAAALLAGLILAGGIVYRIQTDKGELVITTESPDIEVIIKQGGKEVRVLDTKTDKQITLALRSGDYELELKGAPEGLKLDIDKVTLMRGETRLAKIEKITRVPEGQAEEVFRKRPDGASSNCGVDLSPDGRLLLSMHWNCVRVWEVASGKLVLELGESLGRFTPDGQQIVTAGKPDEAGNCLRLYDTASGKLLGKFGRHPRGFWGLGMGPDGRTCLTGGDDTIARLWSVETGELLHSWAPGTVDFIYHRDGRHLFVYPPGQRPWRLWDIRAGKEIAAFEKLAGIRPAYFLPGGREVMTHWTESRDFLIYDVGTGQLVRKVSVKTTGRADDWEHRGRGPCVPVSLSDGTVCVLDLVSGKEVARFAAGKFRPCMAVSGDGRFVAVCAANQLSDVVVWRLPDPSAAKEKP